MHRPVDGDDGGGAVKPILEHLEDLRRTLVRCLLALLAGMAVAAPLAPRAIAALKRPLARLDLDPDAFLLVLSAGGGFELAMRTVFWLGLILAFPLIVLAVAGFVFPGLTRRERRFARFGGLAAVLLFAVGATFGYAMFPLALRALLRVNDWIGAPARFWELAGYVRFAAMFLLCFGAAFELPVVVFGLGLAGLVSAAQLRRYRRHIAAGIFFIAMIATPPDPLSMVLMAGPMLVLQEITIALVALLERRRGQPD